MGRSGSGFRVVGWGVLIVAVVAIGALIIAYQFKLIGDQRTYIDVNSGDIAHRRTVLGITVAQTVVPNEFSDLARSLGLASQDREWQPILEFSWISGNDTGFPLHGADIACAGATWKLRNEKTDEAKKTLLSSYLQLLKAGDVRGMEQLSANVNKDQEQRSSGTPGKS